MEVIAPSRVGCRCAGRACVTERWAPVHSDTRAMEVSDFGDVRVLRAGVWAPLKLGLAKDGYRYVAVAKGGKFHKTNVAWLVADRFIGPRPGGEFVCHLDDVRSHNCVDNLVYGSAKTNAKHAALNGRLPRGTIHASAKLTEEQVRQIRELNAQGLGYLRLGRMFGVRQFVIYGIVKRLTWAHVE